jgi:phage repressor protein C with HTH and peptisase S24 domain
MLKELTQTWDVVYAKEQVDTFLQRVMDSIEYDEIRGEAMRQLHRWTQMEGQRRKGVLSNSDYSQKESEISSAALDILNKFTNFYLPILPVTAIAGTDLGAQYAIEYQQIEEWKHIPKGNIKGKIGIMVEGDSMKPAYLNGDILLCYKSTISNISDRQTVVVVTTDNSIFLKKIKKVENELHLISLNPDFKTFPIPIREVYEVWVVDSKIK